MVPQKGHSYRLILYKTPVLAGSGFDGGGVTT